MSKLCSNCVFWIEDEPNHGMCRRYPPRSMLTPQKTIVSQFPIVKNEWQCGEWQPKEERFNELLSKSLNGDMTDAETIEYQTLAVERMRPTLEREAVQVGELAKVAATNAKLIKLLTDDDEIVEDE